MNIISGIFKSIKIKTSKDLSYRPTKSLVRKSIFDSLNYFNFNSVCDLFSGTGIIGFESASRGAKFITFVDNNYRAIKLIQENAITMEGPHYSYFQKDVFSFLKNSNSYDLIYADPPYGMYDPNKLVEEVFKHLNKKGKLFLECDKKQKPFLDSIVRDYGQTRILQWENN
jgi:16S rRNA (guanine(966)-N(2))-methyltransferase RsmD